MEKYQQENKMKRINFAIILILLVGVTYLNAQSKSKTHKNPGKDTVVDVDTSDGNFDLHIRIPDIPDIPEDVMKLSPEKEQEILKNLMPKIRKELEAIKKNNKLRYNQLLWDSHFRNFDFPFGPNKEARERSKKITDLDIETESLGMKYQDADKAGRENIKTELKQKLGELFELRENNRQEEVKDLEERLSELKKTLQERRENKDEIIQKRLKDLTGESRNIDW